ncbi:hypothetical protein GOP47_0014325 [Adiantum capillus-veneris]|uniref:Uncharacterized protein n=1 Tax=Adiantum capillus-veneris TaxID=13818 RepID=A0A9D4ZDE2_ADICA|nr:hypothetical protein GOP47_0014325 [Adiantum capillus-veneris]
MEEDTSESPSAFGSKKTDNNSFFKSEDFSPAASDYQPNFIYEGPVYHMGVNRLGHHFCHHRFLRVRGTFVEMYKKEPAKAHVWLETFDTYLTVSHVLDEKEILLGRMHIYTN